MVRGDHSNIDIVGTEGHIVTRYEIGSIEEAFYSFEAMPLFR